MRHYTHLSIEEREKLYLRRGQGAKLREIARELGRSVSTISRELKRNERPRHPYSPSQAQNSPPSSSQAAYPSLPAKAESSVVSLLLLSR